MDGGDIGNSGRCAEAALLEALEGVVGELQLPDADAVDPRFGVGREVIGETRTEGADLRDREAGDADVAILRPV